MYNNLWYNLTMIKSPNVTIAYTEHTIEVQVPRPIAIYNSIRSSTVSNITLYCIFIDASDSLSHHYI